MVVWLWRMVQLYLRDIIIRVQCGTCHPINRSDFRRKPISNCRRALIIQSVVVMLRCMPFIGYFGCCLRTISQFVVIHTTSVNYLAKYKVLVIRTGRNIDPNTGNYYLRDSKPCSDCHRVLSILGFQTVFYSTNNGVIEKKYLTEIDTKETMCRSRGLNFPLVIKKKVSKTHCSGHISRRC